MTSIECRYLGKGAYSTRQAARAGIRAIRDKVTGQGGVYTTLYPYRCPCKEHWHLSSSRQGQQICPGCGSKRPSWFDKRTQRWVVYAHGDCLTQEARVLDRSMEE